MKILLIYIVRVCLSPKLSMVYTLNEQFIGTGYNESIRMLGDFGSNMYITQASTAR